MKSYMQLLLLLGITIAGTIQAIKIKIENRLIDNLELVYLTRRGFVSKTIPMGKSIMVVSKSPRFWGPLQFTYNNTTYRLSHTQQNGWKFQLIDPTTKRPWPVDTNPYITLHDAEMVGFVLTPYQGGAKIHLNTSMSGETLQYIDKELEALKQSLHEIFPETQPTT